MIKGATIMGVGGVDSWPAVPSLRIRPVVSWADVLSLRAAGSFILRNTVLSSAIRLTAIR